MHKQDSEAAGGHSLQARTSQAEQSAETAKRKFFSMEGILLTSLEIDYEHCLS